MLRGGCHSFISGDNALNFVFRNWRWLLAIAFFLLGFVGFVSGVLVTERDLAAANPLALSYYSLGLFVLGGMDIGVPTGGPAWGRVCLWIAYIGAPSLTVSAIILEWLQLAVVHPGRWLVSLRNHTIVVGVNDVSRSVMDKLIRVDQGTKMIVVDRDIRTTLRQELKDKYGAKCIVGEYTDEYFLSMLRFTQAKRIVLVSDSDFDNFETASKLLAIAPKLGERTIVHCNKLRYLREMAHSNVVQMTRTFNSYRLAAQYLVRSVVLEQCYQTERLNMVVLAGFGAFGQTVLESLQLTAEVGISEVVIIDADAHRRLMVAQEHVEMRSGIKQHLIQGEIGHPEIWQQVEKAVDLSTGTPLVLLATGQDDENLRAGSWLSKRYPNTKVIIRTQRDSHFAESISRSTDIITFSLSRIFRESLPDEWFTELQP